MIIGAATEVQRNSGHPQEAVRILPATPSAERARVLAAQAQWLLLADRYREAERRATEALAVARTVGARAEEGHALDVLGTCTTDIGHLEQALRIAEEVGNPEGIVRAYNSLGAALSYTGRTREAVPVVRQGLLVARGLGLERAIGSYLAAILAGELFELGDWEGSDRVLTEALERDTNQAGLLHGTKGRLELGRGASNRPASTWNWPDG